jgi:hypothetical protein
MSKQQILHQHSTAAGGTPLNAKLPVTFTAGVAASLAVLYAITKVQQAAVPLRTLFRTGSPLRIMFRTGTLRECPPSYHWFSLDPSPCALGKVEP